MLRVSVIAPVLNEVQFIGYSIMSMLDRVHEFVYALDEKSSDGTRELLNHIKTKYAHEKLVVLEHPTFHPNNTPDYNEAFNRCIRESSGDVAAFIHPDMVATVWPASGIEGDQQCLAWYTNITSYAGDMQTVITRGRCAKWKNIHRRSLGLQYCGGYGSQNEDFYHSQITGNSYKHYGEEFSKYPFAIRNSGIEINHYCELKSYARRLEKMRLCLKTQGATQGFIEDSAPQHPRVTLEPSSQMFGAFEFSKTDWPIPEVFTRYQAEFEAFKKEPTLV